MTNSITNLLTELQSAGTMPLNPWHAGDIGDAVGYLISNATARKRFERAVAAIYREPDLIQYRDCDGLRTMVLWEQLRDERKTRPFPFSQPVMIAKYATIRQMIGATGIEYTSKLDADVEHEVRLRLRKIKSAGAEQSKEL